MRKRTKRFVTLGLSLCLAATAAGAATASFAEDDLQGYSETEVTEALKEELSAYTSTDDFVIATWHSFYNPKYGSTYDQLVDLKKTGHTLIMHTEQCEDIRTDDGPIAGDHEFWKTFDGYANELDLKYFMKFRPQDSTDVEGDIAFVREALSDYCVGYYLGDEPPASNVPTAAQRMRDVKAADPDRFPYFNLYPSYAGTVNLGGTYSDYINRFVDLTGPENIEFLSIDHYPFRDGSDSATYYSDIEEVRKVAYQNGKMKTWAMPQTCTWGAMRTTTRGEERWNVYSYLAYGVKALSSFCWVCPGDSDTEGEGFYEGVIYRDGTIRNQEKYDFLSDLNWETRSIGRVLVKLDTAHAYHTLANAQGVEVLPTNYILKPTSASTDFIVSYMEAKENSDTTDHVMLFNKSYTEGKTVSFEISEFSGIEGVEYYNPYTGKYVPVDISSGMITDTFKAGEGKLYRLIGNINTDMSVEQPKASVEGGNFTKELGVELSCATEDAEVYYTLDGSYPTVNSARYEGGKITVGAEGKGTYVLRSIAYKNGSYSALNENRYFILDDEAEPVTLDPGAWKATGGGNWSYDAANGVYSNQEGGSANWNRSYTYTGAKFSDFMLEANIDMNGTAGSPGYIGFGLRKTRVDSTQDNYMEGFYVGYDSDNNVFVYEGSGGMQKRREAMPEGSSAMKTVQLRVICSDRNIYVYVDGKMVFLYQDGAFDLGAGYISLQAGTFAADFADVTLYDLTGGAFDFGDKQEALLGAEYDPEIMVDKYTLIGDVYEQLPDTLTVTDTNGNETEMSVTWSCADYDKNTPGNYYFDGTIVLPEGGKYLNLYNVRAKIAVFVKFVSDYSEINRLIATVEALDKEDFTEESWERMWTYYLGAKSIVADKTLSQNAIKVGAWQLEDQIFALERVDRFTTVIDSELAKARAVEDDGYTAASWQNLQDAIEDAERVLANGISEQTEIDAAAVLLSNARKGLVRAADKTALNGKIAAAEALDLSGKTEAGKAALAEAIGAAKEVAAREDASEAETAAAVSYLEAAMESLTEEGGRFAPVGTGCGGSLGASSLALAAAFFAAFALVAGKRKKR